MQYFKNGEFEINDTKELDLVLLKISNSLFNLSNSPVFNNRLAIGGVYHKKYYDLICRGFYNNKNIVFNAKNMILSEFLYNLKHNLCNYGIYLYEKEETLYLKIYSGNSFLLDKNQMNYVEKTIKNVDLVFNNNVKFFKLENLYKKNIVSKHKMYNFKIICTNEHLLHLINKYSLSNENSKFTIKIFDNLNYKIFRNKLEINLNKVFKNYSKYDIIDDEIIEKINIENIKKVINNKFLIYNKFTNNFDIFTTLKYLSWRLTNDKDYTKLV